MKSIKKKRSKLGYDPNIALKPVRKFRSHVDPTKCYVDNRVEGVIEKSFKLGALIREANPESWNLLIAEVIKIFENPMPEDYLDIISTDEE